MNPLSKKVPLPFLPAVIIPESGFMGEDARQLPLIKDTKKEETQNNHLRSLTSYHNYCFQEPSGNQEFQDNRQSDCFFIFLL